MPLKQLGEWELERLVRGWRREAGSWFQRREKAFWKERSCYSYRRWCGWTSECECSINTLNQVTYMQHSHSLAHVVWSLLSLARQKTTSCDNGWLETMRRHVQCNWNKASLLRDGKTREPTILSSQTHYKLCRHKGKHSGSDVARLNKVRVPCRATRTGSKNRLLDQPWWRTQRYCHKVNCNCATTLD